MGLAGVGLNVVIGRYYDAAALGIFNQVFALYIVVSQFASFGIWLSVLRHVSEQAENRQGANRVIVSAIVLVIGSSSLVTLACYLSTPWIEALFDSHDVASGWWYALPGLWGYSINKVLLAIINAHRNMRVYSLAQIGRYLVLIGTLFYVSLSGFEPYRLPVALTVPELLLLPLLLAYISRRYVVRWSDWNWSWVNEHLGFGLRSFLSGTVAELNTRVDVVMLGIFTSDRAVGVYSMAAIVAEGLYQLSTILRDNLNPIITLYYCSGRREELAGYLRKMMRRSYGLMGLVNLVAIALFPTVLGFFVGRVEFEESWSVLIVLSVGMALASGYFPLSMLLVQGGFPGTHMKIKLYVVAVNILGNLSLIPLVGIHGAAAGTAVSFVASALLLKYYARVKMELRI